MFVAHSSYIYESNGGRTTETRQAGKQEDTTPKRGSYLPNYFDRTQTKARRFLAAIFLTDRSPCGCASASFSRASSSLWRVPLVRTRGRICTWYASTPVVSQPCAACLTMQLTLAQPTGSCRLGVSLPRAVVRRNVGHSGSYLRRSTRCCNCRRWLSTGFYFASIWAQSLSMHSTRSASSLASTPREQQHSTPIPPRRRLKLTLPRQSQQFARARMRTCPRVDS